MMAASLAIDLNINPFHTTDGTSVDDCTVENLSRITDENKKLKKMLTIVWDKYNSLQAHVKKLMHNKEVLVSNPKKRKLDENVEQSSCKRPNEELPKSGIRIVYVEIDPSDKSLVVKDGYQWRKYGQKVTRNNPSPRAYYKCSFAPTCLVKKKVQRSVDDVGVVVATYEGEHNHRSTMQEGTYALSGEYEIPSSERRFNSYKFDEVLVKQMADSLGKDRNFTSELAASISTKILEVDLFRDTEIDMEEHSSICGNALEERRGKYVELATDYIISHTLQSLLQGCSLYQLCNFLQNCSKDFSRISIDRSGSSKMLSF